MFEIARRSGLNDATSAGGGAEERLPLLKPRKFATKPLLSKQWQIRLVDDISRGRVELVLLFCYIITGLLDSAAISFWGSFISMQTGNTVYLGLGLAAPGQSTRWIKSGLSLGCFSLGSFFFSRFHRGFSPRRRCVLFASFLIQAALTAMAAVASGIGPKPGKEDVTWNVLVPIALVSFQSCGQAVASRALKCNTLTGVVLTSLYCDLFSDSRLLVAKNAERNHRVMAPVLLLIGGVGCGLLFTRSGLGIAGALWAAAALKLLVSGAWLLWPVDLVGDGTPVNP